MLDLKHTARLMREREHALARLEPGLSVALRRILRTKLAYERDLFSSFASAQERSARIRPPALASEFFVKKRLEAPLV